MIMGNELRKTEQVDSWEDLMENQMSVEEFLNMLMTMGKEWRKTKNKWKIGRIYAMTFL